MENEFGCIGPGMVEEFVAYLTGPCRIEKRGVT